MLDELQQLVRAAGLGLTRAPVTVLAAGQDHPPPDTESIIDATRATLGEVSHQAVYDVLKALTRAGLVRRIEPAGSGAAYEARAGANPPPCVCGVCGAIGDVDCAVGYPPCLTASDDHGFEIDEAEVVYWG